MGIVDLIPTKFKYKSGEHGDTDKYTLGIMAQDIDKLYPYDEYSILSKDANGNFMVDYTQLIAPMLKLIQEQEKRIIELENKL
jgi:hypothetical protein